MSEEKNQDDQVRVVARMRPTNETETLYWNVSEQDCAISDDKNRFNFDSVYDGSRSTEYIYDRSIRDMIPGIVKNGLNGIIMAYGQTSGGKTYAMQGDADGSSLGIVQLVADQIFSEMENTPEQDFTIQVSCFEVYNEQIGDLLDRENAGALRINREDPLKPYVMSTDYLVSTRKELVGYLMEGYENRTVDSTCANCHSSRSHCISRILIESQLGEDVLKSELTLVDLAGSESAKHTEALPGQKTQREGSNINKSLLALLNVINCLKDSKQAVITYRDSKLTEALQYSLSRNAKLYIICCAKPTENFASESRYTFRFGTEAQQVKVDVKPNKAKDTNESIIRFLRSKLEEVRERLYELEQERKTEKQSSPSSEEEELREEIDKCESYFVPKVRVDVEPQDFQIPQPSFIPDDSDKAVPQQPNEDQNSIPIPTRVPSEDEFDLMHNISTKTISTAATEESLPHTTSDKNKEQMNQEDDDEKENLLEANLIQKERMKCFPCVPCFWVPKTNPETVQS